MRLGTAYVAIKATKDQLTKGLAGAKKDVKQAMTDIQKKVETGMKVMAAVASAAIAITAKKAIDLAAAQEMAEMSVLAA